MIGDWQLLERSGNPDLSVMIGDWVLGAGD
jgi:hypothetical protein